jgi:hypothetical protein
MVLGTKHTNLLRYKAIIFMKAGPHSGDALKDIIKMKLEEQTKFGRFYWGYSGSLCHPYRVQEFAQNAVKNGTLPLLVLSPTKSAYDLGGIKKVHEYSIDNKKWDELPAGVYLWNCRFAVIASRLREVDLYIDLNEYVTAARTATRPLGEYLKYRVNKACAFLKGKSDHPCLTRISYIAELVFPYCIYLR